MPNLPSTATTLRQVIDRHLARGNPRVLTASDRLDEPVSWVHSSEIFEIGPLLSGGELLLTSGLGLRGVDAGTRRHYVRDLAQRGVVGVAFEIGRSFEAVPEDMVREGSSCRLPLIELGQNLAFIDVCRQANTAIVATQLDELRRRSVLTEALHDDLRQSVGVAGMLAHVAEATGCPILLIASGGALLAAHGVDEDHGAWRMVDAAVSRIPISVRGREVASLIAGPSEPRLPTDLVDALLHVGTGPVAAALAQSGARRFPWGAPLVEELLSGIPLRRGELFARLASGGLAVTDDAHLVPVAAEAPDPRMAEAALGRTAATLGGLAFATVDATVHALILVNDTGTTDAVDQVARAIRGSDAHGERVAAVVGDACSLGGIGPGTGLSLEITASLRRTHERLGLVLGWVASRRTLERVWTSRDLAAESATRTMALQARQELAGLIQPLLDHDAAQSSSLVHTLEIHLLNGCSATKSSEILHVSRQTLYQRLDRIRTLLGFDPTTASTLASVLLALSACRTE